jgi:TPR repeat protein
LFRGFELSPQLSWGADLRIFLTYRRDDSAGQTGRIADRLKREFGEDSLFMDVDAIPLGVDFPKRINDEVARCDVLIAAIGNRWIDLTDETGQRRIDNPLDFVRIEISAALQRDIPLIPILFDGTKIPKAQLLPDDVKGLAFRNGLDVRHATFHSDIDRLVQALKQIWRSDADAMFNLGKSYESGDGVAQDYGKAREWYEKAAAKDNSDGMNHLGLLYEQGQGVAQDYSKAREWYEKAAAKDNSNAMTNLGVLYDNGQGVTRDYGKAREWYEKAAAKDNARAMTGLGVLYYNGQGVAQDYGKARELFEKATAKGNSDAMKWLGGLYCDGQDYSKAREWFEKAAAKGDVEAMNYLSVLYHDGLGVAQDSGKENEWREKAAAAKGDAFAKAKLGR